MIQIKAAPRAIACRDRRAMPLYLIKLLDHGGHVRVADWITCSDDAEAIRRAMEMDVVKIGVGYDVLVGDRLVFRHRRNPPAAGRPAARRKNESV